MSKSATASASATATATEPFPPAAGGPAGPAAGPSFDELVEDLRRLLGPSSGIDSADVDVDALKAAMARYVSAADQWQRYALADPSRNYTRNGVDSMNDKANLLILVWNPRKGSLVHDHADAHCVMKILQGTLVEQVYHWPEGDRPQPLQTERVSELRENDVAYINDRLGLHRMYNPDPSVPAVSLHLYTPPWAAKFGCYAFDDATGHRVRVNLSNLYSDRGVLCRGGAHAVG
ncbi:RmlC-like cupin domain-containing protein [Dipodascopsis tothii]|uniref:RmlC-like cupin domain-containing protein n=1 Tax=Dipodascopsis tothii TaxID=44089 RepID=UPI0034CDE8B5